MTPVTPALDLAIESRGLTKRFGEQIAVNAIDLAVPRGSVFGFLGPNGSGKTTSIRMLLGLTQATSGQISVLGQDMPSRLHEVLPRVGALVEGPAFYPFLSGAANLRRFDTADRHAPSRTRRVRVDEALHRVGLTHAAGKKVHAYSLGMKQRLGIANALLQPRELLMLDEPTNGLDPQGTREVRSLVRSLAAEGTTVFVSSHLLAEVEQMCTHAAVMSAGTLVAQGTLADLRHVGETLVRLRTPDAAAAQGVLSRLGLVPRRTDVPDEDPWVMAPLERDTVENLINEPESLVSALVAAGVRIRAFSIEEPSLEERFVALTGEGFDVVQ
ncbi:ATP-binding cassette domain-containing protein [Cryobacterium sp. TMT1-21]|uniref:ATP-binding cassette domain-containing protein n=1 Tax=Cryobacterium shii TaxID=1259235 RepID=A0AAQ2C339_9MICO|nr:MULTISPECIES: ATP-binding cassette domain-containing protein [Cryobacterium]TFC40957.1 ATP-binding cassette domain-containing protein [Cryobacterium shii]TFC87810.1 ATP-binding cassette domain-containing protein [Cryobacterium sp. TmT2-59]TFD12434.1 ATP-binding cassette domain-containing protein [Cryobacterium sp. TMT1-21]TFD19374.1 ATP-binding cassette domain-containing protein [Cryobacterium sp. TMT2-23]TFD19876.1 ATP-binding cassette domain-containing protein [Cryobacterium sp. TMT4-10]